MKRLIPFVLSMAFMTGAFASSEPKTYTCEGIYALRLANKIEKRDRYNDRWNKVRGDLSYNGALGVVGFMAGAATGSLPILLAGALTPAAISAIKNLDSKEERISKLRDESQRSHKRFMKSINKKISAEISDDEVAEIIQSGFDSGLYCDDMPELFSPSDIKKHVRKVLEEKYGKIEKA